MKANRTVMKLFFAAVVIFCLATLSLYFMLHVSSFQSDSPRHFLHNNRSFEIPTKNNVSYITSGFNSRKRTLQKGYLVTDVRGITLIVNSASIWIPFGKIIPAMIKNGRIYLPGHASFPIISDDFMNKLLPVTLAANATLNNLNNNKNKCNQSNIIAGIDYPGGDIIGGENPAHVTTVLDCCDTCSMTPSCSHFTFLPTSNECWLKQSSINKFPSRPMLPHTSLKAISGTIPVENRAITSSTIVNRNSNLPECCESKLLHFNDNSPNPPTISEVGNLLPSSSYHLRLPMVSGEWEEQFLIGNGLFGAMVGGNIRREIIPLSIQDFFSYKPDYNRNQQQQKNNSKGDFLSRARQQLLSGQFQQAQSTMQTMQHGGLGMFEYLADLFLFFGSSSWILKESQDNVSPNNNNKPPPRGKPPLRARMPPEAFQGRERLRMTIMSHIQPSFTLLPNTKKRTVLTSAGVLDMRNGIATSQFIEQEENEELATETMIDSHDREWFASATDDLLVGSYTCHRSPLEVDDVNDLQRRSTNCLHVAIGWLRDTSSQRGSPIVNYQLSHNEQTKLHQFDMNIKSSKELLVPSVHICAAIRCVSGTTTITTSNNSPTVKDQLLLCNEAERLEVFLSVAAIDSLGKLPEEYDSSSSTMQRLKDTCWTKVNAGVKKGYSQLRNDHMTSFSKAMSRTELQLFTSNNSQTCPNDFSSDRLRSFGQGCRNSSSDMNSPSQQEIEDITIISQLYQMGRYLLLSSGRRSTMNLQGLWADGVRAEWNGDYHMNINIQMMYFGAAGAGLGEVLLPLLDWVEKLAVTGRQTAVDLLQLPKLEVAWVAHGFTDSTLRAMPLADLQWSLCVTCGAWIATTLFDLISYGRYPLQDGEVILKRILQIFRGVAEFFEAYLFRIEDEKTGEVVLLSGPTTSPENSFRYRHGNQSGLSFMAMSPAIDISILREFANAYLTITTWYPKLNQHLFDHHSQATRFQELIQQMPNHGIPKIDPVTKRIMEYPFHLRQVQIDEDLDRGHRHFSLMHWLYPVQYLPEHDLLYEAAQESLLTKRRYAGGHTGWSAVWEATLWARLRESDEAFTSISHLVSKYITTNLLGLHPPLDKQPPQDCETCFAEPSAVITKNTIMKKMLHSSLEEEFINRERGLKTVTNDKFQLDANLGYLAAIHEMLFQSHLPQTLILLPALPRSWREGGQLRGIRGRGDVEVSFRWNNGWIETWAVIIHSPRHPWWRRSSSNDSTGEVSISLLAPNPLAVSLITTSSTAGSLRDKLLPRCSTEKVVTITNDDQECSASNRCRMLSHQAKMVEMSIVLKSPSFNTFPCIVNGCGSHMMSDNKCSEEES